MIITHGSLTPLTTSPHLYLANLLLRRLPMTSKVHNTSLFNNDATNASSAESIPLLTLNCLASSSVLLYYFFLHPIRNNALLPLSSSALDPRLLLDHSAMGTIAGPAQLLLLLLSEDRIKLVGSINRLPLCTSHFYFHSVYSS